MKNLITAILGIGVGSILLMVPISLDQNCFLSRLFGGVSLVLGLLLLGLMLKDGTNDGTDKTEK